MISGAETLREPRARRRSGRDRGAAALAGISSADRKAPAPGEKNPGGARDGA